MNIRILGAGLAGCEAALYLADRGFVVTLYEQKPLIKTAILPSWFAPIRSKLTGWIPLPAC